MKKYSFILKIKLRIKLIILLAIAIIFTLVSAYYFTLYLIKPNTGLVMNYLEFMNDQGQLIFSPRSPFSPAVSAGLIPNKDALLEIDNVPVKNIRDILDANAKIWSFRPVPVTVLRDKNQIVKIYITPELNLLRADWIVTLYFLCVLCVLAYYLIFNHRQEVHNVIAAITTLLFMIYICAQPFYFENVFTLTLIYLGEVVSWLLVVFALYYPKPKFNKIFRRGLLITIGILYVIYIFLRTDAFMQWMHNRSDEYYKMVLFWGQIQNISDLFAYAFFFTFIIHTYIRTADVNIKKHIEWIATGAFIAIPIYVFFDQIPYILGEIPGQRVGMGSFANFFLSFLPLFYLIGLIKSHKLNLQVLNKRSVISLLLALIFLAIFTFLYQPFRTLLMRNYGTPEDLAGFIVAMILFITLFLFYTFLFWFIQKYFFRQYKNAGESGLVNVIEIDNPFDSKYLFSFQKEKINELRILFKGINNKVSRSLKFVNNSLSTLTRDIKRPGEISTEQIEERDSRLKAVVEKAANNVRFDTATINDFIKKIVSGLGQEAFIPISIDIGTIISSACEQVKMRIPGIHLKINNNIQVKVFCHPEEIILTVVRLLENAYEALPVKTMDIEIKSSLSPQYVCIEITDTGIGINEKIISKIFNPFFSTKKDHDGLGLFFCRLLAEKNWGKIEVRSIPNKQTTVFLFLSQRQK